MSSAKRPLRLGLIGCGRLAELGYVPAVAGLDDVALVAVADPDADRCHAVAHLAARSGPAPVAHSGAAELLARGRVDAVVIASPTAEHVPQAELASEAGVPALVEKPPAASVAGAARLAGLESAPWIGFNRRFQHAPPLLERIPAASPVELELELRYRRRSWRPVSSADEALVDLAPHLVDLALTLTGAEHARVRSAKLTAERAELVLETERGLATIRCATDRAHRETVSVRDGEGAMLARSVSGGPLAAIAGRIGGREHPLVGSLRAQLRAFAAAARGGRSGPLATASEGERVMGLIDEARVVDRCGGRS
jgi:predicted dehydrogenase